MIIDGETFACEACVRGHRVSNCQHHDRPLQLIKKKGRPASQCQHCRAMRKSRSAHVKCGCGKRKSNCMQQKELIEGDTESCYCNYGGRCICACRKEQPQLNATPEFDCDEDSNYLTKPESCLVDGLSFDSFLALGEKGHHNPAPETANAPEQDGAYEWNYEQCLQSTSRPGNSSVNNMMHTNGFQSGSLTACESHQEQNPVMWETVIPVVDQSNIASSPFQHFGTQLPLLDLSNIEYPANVNFEPFGAELNTSHIDWTSHELITLNNHNRAQPDGSDPYWVAQPTLASNTTSTWGEMPEVLQRDNTPPETL